MFLKVVKQHMEGPDKPWITDGLDFYEGERIYVNRRHPGEGEPGYGGDVVPPGLRFWRITIERDGGCETIETNSACRYYILNNNGKTIDSL